MGGKTQTQQTSSSTTPNGLAQLQEIYARAQSAASTPYTPYGGQLTAGLNETQTAGIAGANAGANVAQPYYSTAADFARTGASSIDPASVQKYMNPYMQSVIDATQANFRESNGQQQQQVIGNAAMKGALGGNRVGVAQAELARQQKLAQDPVIAGLNQSNYAQALTAAQGDRTAAQTGASQFAGLGTGAQNAALQGSQSQLTAGGVQQGTEQAGLTADYNQYLQQLAYPYQQAQFLAGIGLPAASAMGSSSTGSTSTPGPNPFVQAAGLGLSAASLFSDERVKDGVEKIGETYDGQPIYRYRYKGDPTVRIGLMAQDVEKDNPGSVGEVGGVKTVNYDKATKRSAKKGRFASGGAVGGSPFNFITDASGWIPKVQAPAAPTQQPEKSASGSAPGAAKDEWDSVRQQMGGMKGAFSGMFSGNSEMGSPGVTNPMMVIGAAGGHAVPTFMASGGGVSFDDRFAGAADDFSDAPIIPDPGLQQVDRAAVQAWRDGVDNPNPAAIADASPSMPAMGASPMTAAASPRFEGGSGAVSLPPQITGQPDDNALPASAMAFDQPSRSPMTTQGSQPPASGNTMGGFNPFNLSDKARQAIIAGGLGIAASKSPFALSAIGEGGQRGLGTYAAMTSEEKSAADRLVQQKQNQQRIDQEAKRIAQSAEQFGKTHGLQKDNHSLSRERFEHEKNNQEKAVQYLGPAADGSGSVMMDKKSGRIYVEPVSVAGGKPSPVQAATAKADVNKVGEYAKSADAAREGIATLDNIDALRKEAYSGPLVGRLASAVGHPATQALESQANSLALSVAQRLKGSMSDKDIAFVKAQVPGVSQAGVAGEAVSGILRGAFERASQKGDFFRDWLEVNGSLKDANKAWDRYTNENPLTVDDKKAVGGRKFNPDFNRDYSRYMNPKGAASAATSALPQLPSGVPAGSAYSPSRKMWRSPDGQIFDTSGKPVQG